MKKHITSEQNFYELLKDLPLPKYPFPDLANPHMLELREEYYTWIDTDYKFHPEAAREKHKQHHLTDIPARGLPFLKTLDELLPIARYAAHGAMMDDYFDHCSRTEMYNFRQRIMGLLRGEDREEPTDLGIFRQFYLLRQDAVKCGIPEPLYNKFIHCINTMIIGYEQEKRYIASNTPPPLAIYSIIREDTSGGLPFTKYVCLQKDFRTLPDIVLEHPVILRIHSLASRMIGYHNDFVSLPKELSRKGDVINLIIVMRHEFKVSLEEAYMMALDFHDKDLNEFILLRENLPDFGEWQELAYDYVHAMGIMIQGVYHWHHIGSLRYIPGAYVESEYKSPEFEWQTPT